MGGIIAFIYGIISYVLFFGTFLYAVGFVGNLVVPKSIDSGVGGALLPSLLINAGLLTVFALQHSVMARPAFKKVWTKLVPKSVERSTYVLFASAALILVYWQWRPIPITIWNLENTALEPAMYGLYFLGWGIVLTGTYMISHAHLFGLQQVHQRLKNEKLTSPKFQVKGYYKVIRHPLMAGFLVAFWATPHMTVGRLLFAGASTGYILIALQLEEHDLISYFGDRYRMYREQVPMLIPGLKRKARQEEQQDIV